MLRKYAESSPTGLVEAQIPHVIIVDHQLFAESLSLLLKKNDLDVIINPKSLCETAPMNTVVLIELFLPNNQCGLRLAKHVQQSRPDLIPILWTASPSPSSIWAAIEYRISGFLDKSMNLSRSFFWFNHALANGTAWPGHLLDEGRRWNCEIALRLKTLTKDHWRLWGGLLREENTIQLASQLGWSKRTFERRLSELYVAIGVNCRAEGINLAWKWDLIRINGTTLDWSSVVTDFFINSAPQMALVRL